MKYASFEHLEVSANSGKLCIRIAVIFRPSKSSKAKFLEEFETYVGSLSTTSGKLMIVGDFNINRKSDPTSHTIFAELLRSLNLHQHITESTY